MFFGAVVLVVWLGGGFLGWVGLGSDTRWCWLHCVWWLLDVWFGTFGWWLTFASTLDFDSGEWVSAWTCFMVFVCRVSVLVVAFGAGCGLCCMLTGFVYWLLCLFCFDGAFGFSGFVGGLVLVA